MSKYRSNGVFKDGVMFFLLIYLFYALTNLFFIPHYNTATAATLPLHGVRRQNIQAHHDAPGFINVADKSIINDDLLSVIKSAPVFFLVAFFRHRFLCIEKRSLARLQPILAHSQQSYLSFCILRIWCGIKIDFRADGFIAICYCFFPTNGQRNNKSFTVKSNLYY